MPRKPTMKSIANKATKLVMTPDGGWTWTTAVNDVLGGTARTLTPPESAELRAALIAEGMPDTEDPFLARPAEPTPVADDYDPGADEGPFYDTGPNGPAADLSTRTEAEPREQEPGPDDAGEDAEGDVDEVPFHDQPGYREEAPFDQLTPEEDRAEWTEAARAREPALTMDDDKGGTLVVEYPPGNADAEATAKGLAAALQDENIEGLEISTRERTEEGHPERRPTAIRLLDCKSDLRRLRVTLALEQARELADVGRPISSEAMRSLEALHPLRKTLPGESFDAVFDTVVDAIEEAWGEFYSEPE